MKRTLKWDTTKIQTWYAIKYIKLNSYTNQAVYTAKVAPSKPKKWLKTD